MKYYAVSIIEQCQNAYCKSKATHQIFNAGKSPMAFYCKKCKDKKLFVLNRRNFEMVDK